MNELRSLDFASLDDAVADARAMLSSGYSKKWKLVARADLSALGFGSRPQCRWLSDLDVAVCAIATFGATTAIAQGAER